MAQTACPLWDFGDTLCDERFIWGSDPVWMRVYETFNQNGIGAQWCLGVLDTHAFAEMVSAHVSGTPESIIEHMLERCHAIEFIENTYSFFRRRHLPQAIVTVNPDRFSDVIVPAYGLRQQCDVIVTSWEEGTDDKRVLNRLAIERMGINCDNRAALLIDNKRKNIDEWISMGGSGYRYVDDATFAADATKGIDSIGNHNVL